MRLTIIYPPDYIGGREISFFYDTEAATLPEALLEARQALEDASPNSMHQIINVRPMCLGDVVVAGEQHFLVEPESFRPVSCAFCTQWRRRTLVERMIGSGEHNRIRVDSSRLLTAIRS